MDMDLAGADARIAEYHARAARVARLGPLFSIGTESPTPWWVSTVTVNVVGTLLPAIGAAVRRVGDVVHDSRESLRSREQEFADLGIRWPADAAHDEALAGAMRAARTRRLAAPVISPTAPVDPAPRMPEVDLAAGRTAAAQDQGDSHEAARVGQRVDRPRRVGRTVGAGALG